MPNYTYGPASKDKALRLFEALLSFANRENSKCEYLRDKLTCREEHMSRHQLYVETKIRILEELTKKDESGQQLKRADIRQAIIQMRDFLEILEDKRVRTQGSEIWCFAIPLWSQDKDNNISQLDKLWEEKRPDKSRQQEGLTSSSQPISGSRKANSETELCIGLSSESSQSIADTLLELEHITNTLLPQSCPRIKLNVALEKYDDAKLKFRQPKSYDIIMLDDPWIPAYMDAIQPLDDEPFFKDYVKQKGITTESLFGKIFYKVFEDVCVSNDQILGLPFLGNVQLLAYRTDMEVRIEQQINRKIFSHNLPYLRLDEFENFCSILTEANLIPFQACNNIDNKGISIFWEILRALDHDDEVRNSAVCINLDKAIAAHNWIKSFINSKDKKEWDKLVSSLIAEKTDIFAALVWPGWFSNAIKDNLPTISHIQFKQFAKRPTMGVWSLFLPKEPKSQFRNYAIQVMLALTTDSLFQLLLAKAGNIPVLKNFTKVEELQKIPFWKHNYETIRDALIDSIPRPRTEYWDDIEVELSKQVRKGEFVNVPGRLIFEKNEN